jgi:hypothetical protein
MGNDPCFRLDFQINKTDRMRKAREMLEVGVRLFRWGCVRLDGPMAFDI